MLICHGGPMDGAKVSRRLARGRLKQGTFVCGIREHHWRETPHWRWAYDHNPQRFVHYECDFKSRLIFMQMSERKIVL